MWEDRLLPLKQTVRHLSIPVHHRGSFPASVALTDRAPKDHRQLRGWLDPCHAVVGDHTCQRRRDRVALGDVQVWAGSRRSGDERDVAGVTGEHGVMRQAPIASKNCPG